MSAQWCPGCDQDVDVSVMVWLDASGLPVVWQTDPRPVSPAGYHPACGAALRTRAAAKGRQGAAPAAAPAPRGQLRLF
jgi:hypothetical protein